MRESAGFAGLFSAQTAQKTPEIQQVFPVFSALFERKIAPAKLLGTAKREILASGKATGAGILAMYSEHRQRHSEHRQRHLAREGPFCGCRIPNLHTLRVGFRFWMGTREIRRFGQPIQSLGKHLKTRADSQKTGRCKRKTAPFMRVNKQKETTPASRLTGCGLSGPAAGRS